MKKLLTTLLLLTIITACDSGFRLEKRKYMKGYYVDFKNHHKSSNHPIDETGNNKNNRVNKNEELATIDALTTNDEGEIIIHSAKSSKQTVKKNTVLPAKVSIKKMGEKALVQHQLKKKSQQKTKNTISYFILTIASLFFGWGIKKSYNSQKSNVTRLKNWSVKNKVLALSFSIATRTLLMIVGFWSGVKLFEMDYLFPQHTLHFGIGAYAIGLIIFLFRKTTYERFFSFLKVKLHSLIMAVTGFVLFATIGNNVTLENSQHINTEKHINKRCAQFFESKKSTDTSSLFSFTDAFKNNSDQDPGKTVLKIFLLTFTIISIILLEALAIIFSCALMCEGNEAAGVALMIGGTILIAALAIITIFWINKIDAEKTDTKE